MRAFPAFPRISRRRSRVARLAASLSQMDTCLLDNTDPPFRIGGDEVRKIFRSGAISRGTCMTDIWVYHSVPAIISGTRDDGNLPFHFEPPNAGGHLRIVQSTGKPAMNLFRERIALAPH